MKKYLYIGISVLLIASVFVSLKADATTITRKQYLHQYVATSGTGYAFGSNVTSGDLIVVYASGQDTEVVASTTYSISDSLGNIYTKLPTIDNGATGYNDVSLQAFYTLSSKGGADTITVSDVNITDLGFTAVEYNGDTWTYDTSTSTFAAYLINKYPIKSPTWSTKSNDAIDCVYANEDYNLLGSPYYISPFSLIQYDSGHYDAQEELLGTTTQTNNTCSFYTTNTTSSYGYVLGMYAFNSTTTSSGTTVLNTSGQKMLMGSVY